MGFKTLHLLQGYLITLVAALVDMNICKQLLECCYWSFVGTKEYPPVHNHHSRKNCSVITSETSLKHPKLVGSAFFSINLTALPPPLYVQLTFLPPLDLVLDKLGEIIHFH